MSKLVALSLCTACFVFSLPAIAEDFVLTIARKHTDAKCTSGYLAVNGAVICYALERPSIANIPLISSIPAGSYASHLRYDHPDHWRIELENVPGRTNIQIHIGNTVGDTVGCILVGARMEVSDLCAVYDSKAAYAKLQKSFYGSASPTLTPAKRITVKIEDVK